MGKIAVPVPGTPVRLTADLNLRVSRPPNGDLGPADYYIAANTAGEGLIVAYWIWVPSWNS